MTLSTSTGTGLGMGKSVARILIVDDHPSAKSRGTVFFNGGFHHWRIRSAAIRKSWYRKLKLASSAETEKFLDASCQQVPEGVFVYAVNSNCPQSERHQL